MKMRNIWEHTDEIKKIREKIPNLLIFLDFDGTLAPISQTWELTVFSQKTKNVLKKLLRNPSVDPVIISGRSLEDIKRRIGIPGIIYSGNHGLEWEFDGKYEKINLSNKAKKVLAQLKRLTGRLKYKYPGVLTEDKIFTYAIHYRLLNTEYISAFRSEIKQIFNKCTGHEISVIEGKKVYDVRPNMSWTKGDFCKFLIGKINRKNIRDSGIIYIGDDTTDEDAFRRLKDAVTIRVGWKEKSAAKYFLENQKQVVELLSFINKIYLSKWTQEDSNL